MSRTYPIRMGDSGRLVIPVELRERLKLGPGSTLVLVETPRGVVLATRDQVKLMAREVLAGVDLVAELLADRRSQASADDVA